MTARKKSAAHPDIGEPDYRKLFERLPEPKIIATREGTIVGFSAAASDFFVYTTDRLREIKIFTLFAKPSDRKKILQILEKEGHFENYSFSIKKGDGSTIEVLSTLQRIGTNNAGPDIFLYSFRLPEIETPETDHPFEPESSGLAEINENLRKDLDTLHRENDVLARNSRFFGSLVTGLNHPLAVVDGSSGLIVSNDLFKEMILHLYGNAVHDNSTISDCIDVEKDRKKIEQGVALALNGESPLFQDYFGKNDLSRLFFEISIYPFGTTVGETAGAVLSWKDLTEWKKRERSLQESELRFRSFIENVVDVVYRADPAGNLTYVSPSATTQLGYDNLDSLIGRPLVAFWEHPDGRSHLLNILKEKGSVKDYEVIILKKDGTPVPVSVSIRQTTDERGIITGTEGIIRDISDRKKMEQSITDALAFDRAVIDSSPVGIITFNETGQVISANEAAAKIIGTEISVLKTQNYNTLSSWKGTGMLDSAQEALRNQRAVTKEIHLTTTFGLEKWFAAVFTPFFIGKSVHLLLLINDISEKKKAEEELLRKTEDLHAAYQQISASEEELRQQYDDLARNEQMLRESEDRFRHISSLISDFAYSCVQDPEGTFALDWITGAIHRISGYTSDELKAMGCWRVLVFDEDIPVFEKNVISLTPGTTGICELRIRHKDGRLIWLTSFAECAVESGNSDIHRLYGGCRDITDRKLAEDALKKSEMRFRSLIQNSSDIIRILDQNGQIVYDSPSSAKILGYPEGSLVGTNPLDLIHPDDKERVQSDLNTVYSKTNPGTATEFRIKKADGEYLYVESIGVNMIDVPEVRGIVITTRPIQERKIAERALQESEEKFRLMFHNSSDGIILYEVAPSGMPGKILDANDAVKTQLGYSAEEFLAKSMPEINGKDFAKNARQEMMELFNNGQIRVEGEMIRKDGSLLPVEVSARLVKTKDKPIVISTIRDISRRKREDRALRIANQKLQLMNIVAWHDIQNKVTGLRGYVELSKDLVTDEKVKKYIASEEEVLKVIHRQLEYTKEYQEMGVHPPQWVNVAAILRMVLSFKETSHFSINVDVNDVEIFCDPVIEKVFSHLIENTKHHSMKATQIRISERETSDGLVLIYEDDGIGIPPEKKRDLFTRGVGSSHGFSMFFIHDILEISDMTIRETGEPGKGVRFEILVPRGLYRIRRQEKLPNSN